MSHPEYRRLWAALELEKQGDIQLRIRCTKASPTTLNFCPSLTFTIMFVHESREEECEEENKRLSFCVDSVSSSSAAAAMTECEPLLNLSHCGAFMWLHAGQKTIPR